MSYDFNGKTALVTGAGKGIGRAIAKCLAKNGAEVIALTRTQSDLDSLKKEIPDLRTICVDLANLDEAIKAVEEAGVIHILVNNAAYIPVGKEFMEITTEIMQKSMNVNVIAPVRLTQIIAERLIKEDASGAIVNISTVGSDLGGKFTLAYCSSKSALNSVTRTSAFVLAPHKIRVNCVSPGLTNTPVVKHAIENGMGQVAINMINQTPLKRAAEPEEIADTVIYLLSDKASFLTGQVINVDGGYLNATH